MLSRFGSTLLIQSHPDLAIWTAAPTVCQRPLTRLTMNGGTLPSLQVLPDVSGGAELPADQGSSPQDSVKVTVSSSHRRLQPVWASQFDEKDGK